MSFIFNSVWSKEWSNHRRKDTTTVPLRPWCILVLVVFMILVCSSALALVANAHAAGWHLCHVTFSGGHTIAKLNLNGVDLVKSTLPGLQFPMHHETHVLWPEYLSPFVQREGWNCNCTRQSQMPPNYWWMSGVCLLCSSTCLLQYIALKGINFIFQRTSNSYNFL